jgi:hypothetical protein
MGAERCCFACGGPVNCSGYRFDTKLVKTILETGSKVLTRKKYNQLSGRLVLVSNYKYAKKEFLEEFLDFNF